MSIFGSVLGAGVNLLGSKLANSQRRGAASAALNASSPYDVSGIFGEANFIDNDELKMRLSPALRQGFAGATALGNQRLDDLGTMDFQAREAAELERLRTLRRPEIDDARSALQSRLLARGRIGLGKGGGVSGGIFNPETAALEEAIMRAQLGDIGAARQFSQQEQGFLQNSAQGAFGLAGSIGQLPNAYADLGISAGRNASPGIAAMPGMAQASTTQGFFSALGNSIPGLFGGEPDASPYTFAGTGRSPAILPYGSRPNGLGGLFL